MQNSEKSTSLEEEQNLGRWSIDKLFLFPGKVYDFTFYLFIVLAWNLFVVLNLIDYGTESSDDFVGDPINVFRQNQR